MKRNLILILSIFLIIILVACGNSESKETLGVLGKHETLIVDNEYVKATLVEIEYNEEGDIGLENYLVHVEVENKTGKQIIVQAQDVYADDADIDNMIFFSPEIERKDKVSEAIIIENHDGDLPALEEKLAFNFVIVEPETFDTIYMETFEIVF